MTSTDTVVVGAGHAGLAVSRLLTEAARDHVVLERGRVAERWHSQRWDSLRLLTPNWMTRLPGWSYSGGDPDGFQTAAEFATSLRSYARGFDAPVLGRTAVTTIRPRGDGYTVTTTSGIWRARNVVLATGYCDIARIPPALDRLDPDVRVVSSADYRNPAQLPPGGVLVVGASASGVQIADELARSGRRVVLAVGAHTRVPRRYRGRDVMGWLDRLGLLDRPADEVADLDRARREPSLQLVGRPGGGTLDLGSLQRSGVLLAGRLAGTAGSTVRFADDLARTTADADERLRRLLARIDTHINTSGLAAELPPAEPLPPVRPAPVWPSSTWPPPASPPSSPRPATGAPTPGCRCPSSTPPARSGSVAAAPRSLACTWSGCGSRPGATRPSSTAPDTTRRWSSTPSPRAAAPPRRPPCGGPDECCEPTARRFDVVVVGARCAGAATAMLLARSGLDVLVLDRSRYGSDTVSTHGLVRGGVLQLRRWGLLDRLVDAGTPPIRRTVFHYRGDPAPSGSTST